MISIAENRKDDTMSIELKWLGHASFEICSGDTTIYIDPWKISESGHAADIVLVSHSHYDHYSAEDIAKVSKAETKLIASADVIKAHKDGQAIASGETIDLGDVKIIATAAYNPEKQFHPKSNNWVGFIVAIDSKRIYYAGDTELIEEMKDIENIDLALLPVGGTYTMDPQQAAQATKLIKPAIAIPYHWGDIVGSRKDAEDFMQSTETKVQIISPDESVKL